MTTTSIQPWERIELLPVGGKLRWLALMPDRQYGVVIDEELALRVLAERGRDYHHPWWDRPPAVWERRG